MLVYLHIVCAFLSLGLLIIRGGNAIKWEKLARD